MAAERWMRSHGSKGIIDFIEAIPYRETREYVSSIIRNYYWYHRRIRGETIKDLALFWSVTGTNDKTADPQKARPSEAPEESTASE
jgi:hypothetical protein